jgi:DNA-binding response OmpR family regulator
MSEERIVLIEDDPAVAKGLSFALEQEGYAVMWAEDGSVGHRLVEGQSPHLIILDIRLPDTNGFDLCRRLRQEGFRQPILMLTARDEEVDKVLGFELGADDYVVKPYQLRELLSRIRALLRRAYGELSRRSRNEKITFDDVTIDLELLQVYRDGRIVYLTPTEFRLLRYLISNPDRPVTRDQILEAVWGYHAEVGYDRTVDVHMRHLREKLERDPTHPRRLITVRGHGYKFANTPVS